MTTSCTQHIEQAECLTYHGWEFVDIIFGRSKVNSLCLLSLDFEQALFKKKSGKVKN